MRCQSFEGTISELARDRSADHVEADARARAVAHLEECAECELRLQDERALTSSLRAMATEMKSLTAPERVAEHLLKTFRQTRLMSEVKDQRLEVRRRWIVAVAAVLLVTLSVAGLRWYLRHSQPGSLPTQNALAESSPKPTLSIVKASSINSPAQAEKQLPVHIVRRTNFSRPARSLKGHDNPPAAATNGTANDTDSEVATSFMPLDYAGPINLQDGGQLVRVELSRSAMLSMGLPVNMDRYGERVKADVLLGADGLARAIRFVQ